MASKVNQRSNAVDEMTDDWDKIDALVGGTPAMRRARTKYLPQFPAETDAAYEYRVKTSTLFNSLGRTVENMAAKPFVEAVTYTEVDPKTEAWFENIDLCGNNLTVFAHTLMTAGLKYGLTHILVESPVTQGADGSPLYKTKAAEDAAGVRPYLLHINPRQILGWKSAKLDGGREMLTQVRIMEVVDEEDGDFGTASVPQVRVLEIGIWRTFRKNDRDEWTLHEEGRMSLDFIPLVTFYTRRTGFMTAVPPLRDLADLNIKHWQSSSDQDSILHVARVPILAICGATDGQPIEIGKNAALVLPQGAEVKYVEHTGKAIEAGRASLQDLENQMRAMGAELLVETQVQSTATQNNIEDGEAKCQLARMVEGLEDALDNAVDIMHRWVSMEFEGGVDIYDDFASGAIMQAAGPFLISLVQAVESGILSKEDAFAEMQRYGIVNPDLVWTDVQKKIKADPPKPAPPAKPRAVDE